MIRSSIQKVQNFNSIRRSGFPFIKSIDKLKLRQSKMIRFASIRHEILPFLSKEQKSNSLMLRGFRENHPLPKQNKSFYKKSNTRHTTIEQYCSPKQLDLQQLKCRNQSNLIKESTRKTNKSIFLLQLINDISNDLDKQYDDTFNKTIQFCN